MKNLILVLFVYLLNGVYSQQQCTTPDQIRGSCIPLNRCTRLYNLIAATPLSNSNRVFLQQSQCGYSGGQVLVCCGPVATPAAGGNGANLLPQPGVCGSGTEDRILGGTATDIDEFPWMVLLEFSKPNNQKGFHCGGVLINNRYVVTASHCVNGRAIPSTWNLSSVRLGEYDTKSERDCVETDCADPVVNVRIAEKIPHESYDPASNNQANDIALLRLERTVQFTDFIKPICLPRTQSLRNADLTGIALSVSGWGKTENVSASNLKLKVTVNGVANAECNRIYSSQRITLQSSQFCAGGEKGRDSCSGDSGGPIMAIDTSTRTAYWYLAGIVSFGPSPCGLEGWPGVYTKMGNYVDWIESKIRA